MTRMKVKVRPSLSTKHTFYFLIFGQTQHKQQVASLVSLPEESTYIYQRYFQEEPDTETSTRPSRRQQGGSEGEKEGRGRR